MIASKSMRIWFAVVGAVLWTGIYLTGFALVSWVIYFPAIAFIFSAITGICPGQIAVFKMFGEKTGQTS